MASYKHPAGRQVYVVRELAPELGPMWCECVCDCEASRLVSGVVLSCWSPILLMMRNSWALPPSRTRLPLSKQLLPPQVLGCGGNPRGWYHLFDGDDSEEPVGLMQETLAVEPASAMHTAVKHAVKGFIIDPSFLFRTLVAFSLSSHCFSCGNAPGLA